jgi:hypothetical protein
MVVLDYLLYDGFLYFTCGVRFSRKANCSFLTTGSGGSFTGVKRSECKVDHSPPSADIKNAWMYISIPSYLFTLRCVINEAQEQLYLTFTPPDYIGKKFYVRSRSRDGNCRSFSLSGSFVSDYCCNQV